MYHQPISTSMDWSFNELYEPSHIQKKHRADCGTRIHDDIFQVPSIDSTALRAYDLASQSIDSIPGIVDSEDSVHSKQSTPSNHSYDQSDFMLGEDDGFFEELQEMGKMSDLVFMGAAPSSSQLITRRDEPSDDNSARKAKRPRTQAISHASTDINSAHKSKVASLVNKNKAAFKPVVKIPHMLASDIRKNYTVMWGNAFNAYDPKLLLDFLMRYVRQDSTLVKAFPQGGNDMLSFPSHIQLHGKKELLLYWLGVLFLSPDQVIVHDYVRIEPRKDGIPGSKILCRLQVRGTRPFALSLSELIEQINYLVNDTIAAEGRNVHDISDEEYMQELLKLDPYQCVGDIERRMQMSVVPSNTIPGPLNVVGMFSFLLDSNKYVESMDYSIAPDTLQHRSYFND